MRNIDTYDHDRARRARIEAEYRERVKGQLFTVGTGYDTHTGGQTPQEKHGKTPVMQSVKINLR